MCPFNIYEIENCSEFWRALNSSCKDAIDERYRYVPIGNIIKFEEY
jgi:hypothetical protein